MIFPRNRILMLIVFLSMWPLQLLGQSSERPNVLFIYMDDLGWNGLSYMGSDFYETPNLDRLAKQGMIFTNAYSSAANCAPARASLLSGQYAPRHEIYNVGTKRRGKKEFGRLKHIPGVETLRPDITTWAKSVQEAGYVTATMGKWHLSEDPRPYGFDVNIGGSHSGHPPKGYFPPHTDAPGLENSPAGEYVTDRLYNEAISFIEKNQSRPWFLYLTHFAVHTPLQGKKSLIDKYEKKPKGNIHDHAVMAAMIQSVDDGVGRLEAKLKQLGLDKNTAIVFTSDNGGYGPATSMKPLKGYKGTYYEGGIRVPFFVRWPGVVVEGSRSDEPIIGVDLYPTFIDMTGAKLPNQTLDGVNLTSLFKGEGDLAERSLFWHFPAYLQAYKTGSEESRDPLYRSRPTSTIRFGDWKLHEYFEDGALELYNLKDDISESVNLVASRPEKAAELHQKLKRWRQSTNAPVPSEVNPDWDQKAERAAIASTLIPTPK